MCVQSFSHVRPFVTLWTVPHQAPLSMGFSRQDYWSGLPCPPPGHLPDPGIEITSAFISCIAGRFFTHWTTWEAPNQGWNESESRSVVSNSLWPHGLYSPWNFPGQNTGVGSLSLLQGIFPTQGSNPGPPHCRRILYQLSHKGSPRIQEWIAYPFCSRSAWPRNWTGVSCIACRFLTNWAIREAPKLRLTIVLSDKIDFNLKMAKKKKEVII